MSWLLLWPCWRDCVLGAHSSCLLQSLSFHQSWWSLWSYNQAHCQSRCCILLSVAIIQTGGFGGTWLLQDLILLLLFPLIKDATHTLSILALLKKQISGTWSSGRVLCISVYFCWCFFGIKKSVWFYPASSEALSLFEGAPYWGMQRAELINACNHALAWEPAFEPYGTGGSAGYQCLGT